MIKKIPTEVDYQDDDVPQLFHWPLAMWPTVARLRVVIELIVPALNQVIDRLNELDQDDGK